MSTQMADHLRHAAGRTRTIPDQDRVVANPITELLQGSMTLLVRQGQDTSLRSLQMRADLARKLGPRALSSPVAAGIASHAYDPLEKLLEAQRQVVDELVTTQRQLARQLLDATGVAAAISAAR